MTKIKRKYPDGGTLPTIISGTPEHTAYLEQQKRYADWQAKHNTLLSSGYSTPSTASQAEIAGITPKLVTPNTTASGYNVYNYDPNKVTPNANTDEYFDSATGKYYVPYYNAPSEATIQKSQTELDAEKQKAEQEAFAKQYQGYILTNIPVQNDDNTWTNTQEAVPLPVGKDIPTDGTFHSSLPAGAVVKYASGGKFLQGLGDTARITGDTLLSTLGLTDVINDDMYKNQKFADASRVAETVGGYAGKIAGNILLPGVGGAAVGTAQKMLGSVDGEDQFRSHMDEISSLKSQDQLGKFNNAAYSTPQNLNQIQDITTGVGELATNFSANGMQGMQDQFGNMKQAVNNFNLPTFPDGGILDYSKQILNQAQPFTGKLNNPIVSGGANNLSILDSIKYANRMNQYNSTMSDLTGTEYEKMGLLEPRRQQYTAPQFADGGFVEYNGPDHSNGGVPINQHGQPTTQPNAQVAEVEGGETMMKDDITKYIFSDRLVVDPKAKLTFADMSKKINNKYKGDKLDKFQKEARDLELNRLKEEQEAFKQTIGGNQSQQPMMAYGGGLPRFDGGGNVVNNLISPYTNYYDPSQPYKNNTLIDNIVTPYNQQSSFQQFTPLSPEELDRREQAAQFNDPNSTMYVPDSPLEENYNIQQDGDPNGYKSGAETFGNQTGINGNYKPARQTPVEGQLPQDKINPLGYAASNIGNIYDLAQSTKPAKANKFATPTLQGINLDAQRKELEKQAGLSTAISRENSRQLATSSGQALGNQIVANALINSSLGSGLSQSWLNQITSNTDTANKQSSINAEIRNQEIIADQMDKANRQSTQSQALHSIGNNTQGYTRDLKSAKVGNENNQMWFDAIKEGKYTQLGFDSEGKMVIQLQDGRVVTQPK